MITVENRYKDAKNEMPSAYQLSRYISVKQINNVFKWFMPYKFKTLIRLAPKSVKQMLYGMIDFLNCKNVVVRYDDEECQPVWQEDNIPLYKGEEKPFFIPFLLKDKTAPAVVVIPGGAYLSVWMQAEGIDTAKRLNELGFHAIVLSYRVSPARYPAMHLDLIRTIRLMRKNAQEWGIIPDQIIALGYSAGGHLALSVNGVYDELKNGYDDLQEIDGRPNAIVSGYGMSDLKCRSFTVTADMILLGDNYNKKESERLCVHNLVNKDYPPVFMFTQQGDTTVPPKTNCIRLKGVLDSLGVKNELHIYPGSRHGFALGDGEQAGEWCTKMVDFLKNNGVID